MDFSTINQVCEASTKPIRSLFEYEENDVIKVNLMKEVTIKKDSRRAVFVESDCFVTYLPRRMACYFTTEMIKEFNKNPRNLKRLNVVKLGANRQTVNCAFVDANE